MHGAEVSDDGFAAEIALGERFRQHALGDGSDGFGDAGIDEAQAGRIGVEHARHGSGEGGGEEGLRSAEELVEHKSEREDVGASVVRLFHEDLGRHVGGGSAEDSGVDGADAYGRGGFVGECLVPGDAEVQDLDASGGGEH